MSRKALLDTSFVVAALDLAILVEFATAVGIEAIVSFDADFDGIPGITRIN